MILAPISLMKKKGRRLHELEGDVELSPSSVQCACRPNCIKTSVERGGRSGWFDRQRERPPTHLPKIEEFTMDLSVPAAGLCWRAASGSQRRLVHDAVANNADSEGYANRMRRVTCCCRCRRETCWRRRPHPDRSLSRFHLPARRPNSLWVLDALRRFDVG